MSGITMPDGNAALLFQSSFRAHNQEQQQREITGRHIRKAVKKQSDEQVWPLDVYAFYFYSFKNKLLILCIVKVRILSSTVQSNLPNIVV